MISFLLQIAQLSLVLLPNHADIDIRHLLPLLIAYFLEELTSAFQLLYNWSILLDYLAIFFQYILQFSYI